MARPITKGLAYFPFDTDFFSDRKIKSLRGKYGADGIVVYLYILTEIYKENGYFLRMDKDFYLVASDDLGMSADKIEQIVVFLCERSMLDKQLLVSDDVLTAHSIQRRFQKAVSERGQKRDIEVDRKIWVLSESETEPFIKCTDFESFSVKNSSYSEKNPSYSEKNPLKENKSKVNKSKVSKKESGASFDSMIDSYTDNEELRFVLKEHLKTRKAKSKATLTNYAIELSLKTLDKLANDDDEKIRIVKKSIECGWVGFFPEKKENSLTKAGSLNNFHQDSPDFKAITQTLIERQMSDG